MHELGLREASESPGVPSPAASHAFWSRVDTLQSPGTAGATAVQYVEPDSCKVPYAQHNSANEIYAARGYRRLSPRAEATVEEGNRQTAECLIRLNLCVFAVAPQPAKQLPLVSILQLSVSLRTNYVQLALHKVKPQQQIEDHSSVAAEAHERMTAAMYIRLQCTLFCRLVSWWFVQARCKS